MIDPRINSIIYQSEIYYRDLVNSLEESKLIGKALEPKWEKADTILGYLEVLNYRGRLTDQADIDNVNYILECLIKLCELNQYPVASPLAFQAAPSVLVGIPGAPGANGAIGPRGYTGLATDFLAGPSTITIVADSFPIGNAKAARWDYVVLENGGAERAGSILGHWNSTGTVTSLVDTADDDTIASTDGIEFDIQSTSTTIYLISTITSGTWTISGSRYFIPNNGNGTGPISGLLPNGKVYIGNNINLAQDQFLSGAISLLNNTGVTQINSGYITDSMISASAAITLSKLAALPISKLVITDGAGILTTTNSPTLTEVGYLSGVSSAIQTQLGARIIDPTTSIGDIIARNASNTLTRLPIGSASQVLTVVGGVPVWQNPAAGFADPMTTVGDTMIRNGSNVTARLGIGTSGQILTVSGGLPVWQTPVVTGGTVTSVGATAPAAGFTISGSPITTSGSFTFTLANDLAAVEGLSATGIIRRTAPEVWSAGGLVLTTEGGTNISSYTTGDMLYSSSANILSKLGIGASNTLLYSAGGVPTWTSANLTWDGTTFTSNTGLFRTSSNPAVGNQFFGGTGTSGTPQGGGITIWAGGGYSGGGLGGDITILSGVGVGANKCGNIILDPFQSGSLTGYLIANHLPTSPSGLPTNGIWLNSGVLTIGTPVTTDYEATATTGTGGGTTTVVTIPTVNGTNYLLEINMVSIAVSGDPTGAGGFGKKIIGVTNIGGVLTLKTATSSYSVIDASGSPSITINTSGTNILVGVLTGSGVSYYVREHVKILPVQIGI